MFVFWYSWTHSFIAGGLMALFGVQACYCSMIKRETEEERSCGLVREVAFIRATGAVDKHEHMGQLVNSNFTQIENKKCCATTRTFPLPVV